jgi:hypothetical protein
MLPRRWAILIVAAALAAFGVTAATTVARAANQTDTPAPTATP